MDYELVKTFNFNAAHFLPGVPAGHKCGRMHGHNYRIDVRIGGVPDPETGWVVDYADIKRIVGPIIDELDHRTLNEIPGLENSTSETLGAYLLERISPHLPGLRAVAVWESETSCCIVRA